MTSDIEPRWRFAAFAGTAAEDAERKRTRAAIQAWWAEFARRGDDIIALFKNMQKWDLPGWMNTYLGAISPALMWEFGPGLSGGHRLVITPEQNGHLRPLLDEVLKKAPPVPGWEFYPHRLPESMEMTIRTVEVRARGGTIADGCFKAEIGRGHRIGLTFGYARRGLQAFKGLLATEKEDLHPFFVATETLLGEELLDKWVGRMNASSKDAKGGAPLSELRPVVERLIEQVRSGLPDRPWLDCAKDEKWSLLKIEPEVRADYPRQEDLFVAKTPHVEMWRAGRGDMAFHSSRFSRHGERFCYVKLDGSEGVGDEVFADKSEIEDALDEALGKDGLGISVGGGTGRRYSYVDLALMDVDRAIEVVRRVLRGGKVPKRSWVQFFDREWEREWVGIYDDSPSPPMPELE